MKRKSPLVVSHNQTLGMFASDPIATSSKFKTYLDIEDGEFVELNRIYDTIEVNVYDSQLDKADVSSRYLRMTVDTEDTNIQDFPNYMWKEMYEIPKRNQSSL